MTVNLDGYETIGAESDEGARFPLAAGDTVTRNFELHPMARIYGTLVDRETGSLIEGHTVSAIPKEYASDPFPPARDPNLGEFNIRNLEPGDYLIRIDSVDEAAIVFSPPAVSANTAVSKNVATPDPSPPKYYGQRWYPDVARIDLAIPIHLAEGENRNLRISLQSRETYSLSGTIEVPRGFERQPVSLVFRTTGTGGERISQAPAPGPFRIDNLAPGSYWLSFTAGKPPNQAAGDYPVEITDHDIDSFKAALAPYAGVSGEVRVLEEDVKLPGKLAVRMQPMFPWQLLLQLGSAGPQIAAVESGRFHQESIRPGEYRPLLLGLPLGYAVAQVLSAGSSARDSAVTLSAPGTPIAFVVTSRPGAVAGVVRDENQVPVRGAAVALLPDPLSDTAFAFRAFRTGESGDDGAFAFKDLAPGKYRAVVLTEPKSVSLNDVAYLRERAASAEPIELRAGQLVTVNLRR